MRLIRTSDGVVIHPRRKRLNKWLSLQASNVAICFPTVTSYILALFSSVVSHCWALGFANSDAFGRYSHLGCFRIPSLDMIPVWRRDVGFFLLWIDFSVFVQYLNPQHDFGFGPVGLGSKKESG